MEVQILSSDPILEEHVGKSMCYCNYEPSMIDIHKTLNNMNKRGYICEIQ